MTAPPICRRCGVIMVPGLAMVPTVVAGVPDFPGDDHASTFSVGGPGKMVTCMKCPVCGHSIGRN